MRLPARPVPDQETTAAFRRDTEEVIRKTCAGCKVLYRGLGMVPRDLTAIHGCMFKATGSRGRNLTTAKFAGHLEHFEPDAELCMTELARSGRRKQTKGMPTRLSIRCSDTGASSKEVEKLGPMRTAWADAPERQVSLTDPETRVTATVASNAGPVGCASPRAAYGDTRLFVIRDVARGGFNWGQPSPMAPTALDAPWRDRMRAPADNSCCSSVVIGVSDKGRRHGDHAAPPDLGQLP
ncbi:hypothetical protein [Paracoccus sp. ME4]|uniref:hypothetical protein n=1 Tax=Paracoccus sp. ME4 TaxID=3138066 RepID=UPI00398B511A